MRQPFRILEYSKINILWDYDSGPLIWDHSVKIMISGIVSQPDFAV